MDAECSISWDGPAGAAPRPAWHLQTPAPSQEGPGPLLDHLPAPHANTMQAVPWGRNSTGWPQPASVPPLPLLWDLPRVALYLCPCNYVTQETCFPRRSSPTYWRLLVKASELRPPPPHPPSPAQVSAPAVPSAWDTVPCLPLSQLKPHFLGKAVPWPPVHPV